jgi:Rha family phage regulatory protein
LRNGLPFTDTLAIAKEFGRRHDNVLRSISVLIQNEQIGLLDFEETSYADQQGKIQRLIELSERGALIAMPFIGGRRSREGQAMLVDAFLLARQDLRNLGTTDWHVCRKKASIAFEAMTDALCDVRTEDGKATYAYHYATEAKLVNWVVFGRFESIARNCLSQKDLHMLEAVEVRNAILIARGKTYEDRKQLLQAYYGRISANKGAIQ